MESWLNKIKAKLHEIKITINKIASFICMAVLAIFIFTVFTVDYVGVQFTYTAVPVIVISGLIWYITFSRKK